MGITYRLVNDKGNLKLVRKRITKPTTGYIGGHTDKPTTKPLPQKKTKNIPQRANYSVRKAHQIRNLIQEALSKRPMTKHELHTSTGLYKTTLDLHLKHLQSLGVVSWFTHSWRNRNKKMWKLNR